MGRARSRRSSSWSTASSRLTTLASGAHRATARSASAVTSARAPSNSRSTCREPTRARSTSGCCATSTGSAPSATSEVDAGMHGRDGQGTTSWDIPSERREESGRHPRMDFGFGEEQGLLRETDAPLPGRAPVARRRAPRHGSARPLRRRRSGGRAPTWAGPPCWCRRRTKAAASPRSPWSTWSSSPRNSAGRSTPALSSRPTSSPTQSRASAPRNRRRSTCPDWPEGRRPRLGA